MLICIVQTSICIFYLFWSKNNIKVSTIIIVCADFPPDGKNDWTWEPQDNLRATMVVGKGLGSGHLVDGVQFTHLFLQFFFFFFFTFYLFNFHFFLFFKKKLKLFFESIIKIESCFLQLLILTIHKNYIKCNTLISICLQYTCFGSAFSFEHKKMKMNLMAVLVHVHCKKYWVGKIAINS